MKILAVVLLIIGLGSAAIAGPSTVPEISPASAGSALALISGVLILIGGRRKK
jgi:hypothetical protein